MIFDFENGIFEMGGCRIDKSTNAYTLKSMEIDADIVDLKIRKNGNAYCEFLVPFIVDDCELYLWAHFSKKEKHPHIEFRLSKNEWEFIEDFDEFQQEYLATCKNVLKKLLPDGMVKNDNDECFEIRYNGIACSTYLIFQDETRPEDETNIDDITNIEYRYSNKKIYD